MQHGTITPNSCTGMYHVLIAFKFHVLWLLTLSFLTLVAWVLNNERMSTNQWSFRWMHWYCRRAYRHCSLSVTARLIVVAYTWDIAATWRMKIKAWQHAHRPSWQWTLDLFRMCFLRKYLVLVWLYDTSTQCQTHIAGYLTNLNLSCR